MRQRTTRTAVVTGALLVAAAITPLAAPASAGSAPAAAPATQPMVSLGHRGEEVKVVQRRVGVAVDGRYGEQTRRAVQGLQSAAGLAADGIVGPLTWAALGSAPSASYALQAAAPSSAWRIIGTRSHSWRCPVPGATFIDDYGVDRPGGRVHEGIDMFASRSTAIRAPVSGRVEPYDNSLGGTAIRLYGNDGNRYYFAHLERYGATGTVAAGTTIGYVGNTGDAAGGPTHLHFEVHPNGGDAVDPFPTITLACRH